MWPWGKPSGYLSYITDDRNNKYVRFYVGQCSEARRRIIRQHVQSIQRQRHDNLHYYVTWLGNGHRSANFIRLWEISSQKPDEELYCIQANLLEALLCRALDSHHGSVTPDIDLTGRSSSYGLNIMTPLGQSRKIDRGARIIANSGVSQSPDPQIAHWVSFRATMR